MRELRPFLAHTDKPQVFSSSQPIGTLLNFPQAKFQENFGSINKSRRFCKILQRASQLDWNCSKCVEGNNSKNPKTVCQ